MIRDLLVVSLCVTALGVGLVSAFGFSFCAGGADETTGSRGFLASCSGFFPSALA